MPATEKDLAEDAPWKKIQQNTFTRWCNEHLKCVSKRIANLQTDLSDGLRLIALLEVLSQKKMHRKHNQRPTFRQMQLENVSVALEFLDRESIKLVSIGEGMGSPVALGGRGRETPRVLPSPPGRPLADTPPQSWALPQGPPRPPTSVRASRTKARRPAVLVDRYAPPPAGPRLAHAQTELTSSTGRAPTSAPSVGDGLGGRAAARLWPCAQCPISNKGEASAFHPLEQFGEGPLPSGGPVIPLSGNLEFVDYHCLGPRTEDDSKPKFRSPFRN